MNKKISDFDSINLDNMHGNIVVAGVDPNRDVNANVKIPISVLLQYFGGGGASASFALNVKEKIGTGSSSSPIDLSDLDIENGTILYFPKGVYYVAEWVLSNVDNLTIIAYEAEIIVVDDCLVDALNCRHFCWMGGVINGNNQAEWIIQIKDSPECVFENILFCDAGSVSRSDTALLKLLGDCTGFDIRNCTFDGCTSGTIASDGFIHSYGVMINRLSSSNTYSKNGSISNCNIKNISSTDSGSTKGDGDGIFIQAPPYLEEGEVVWRDDIRISIENCNISDCKKRGIKVASVGVAIRNSTITGAFYYAGIDAQYGHMLIENCTVINTSDYTESITSAVVATEGGLKVIDCTLKAPYTEYAYHPGIRMNKRLPASVIPNDIPWDSIYIERCYFDQVSYAVNGIVTGENDPLPINGIYIRDCRIGRFNNNNPFTINGTTFSEIKSFELKDFYFDYGDSRDEIKNQLSSFNYPLNVNILPLITQSCEISSGRYEDEPVPSNSADGQPVCLNYRILFHGSDMGQITYREWKGCGSIAYGNRAPASLSNARSIQLLYYSKVGDKYVDISNGIEYICISAGSSGSIGSWAEIGSGTIDLENGDEVSY